LRQSPTRWLLALLAVFIASTTLAADLQGPLAKQVNFDIEAQPLDAALLELSRQAGIQVMLAGNSFRGQQARAVKGKTTVAIALATLLKETGLTYETVGGTVTVKPAQTSQRRQETGAPLELAWAQTGRSLSDQTLPGGSAQSQQPQALEEIVVTAQKKSENIQDVPMSLTALSGDQLARTQSYRFEDFVGTVPGLTFTDYGALGTQLVIRGLTSGHEAVNSSVATYIDETPYTAEGPFAGSYHIAPNLDPFDMQRIEVLRGPQGTLYGANALGGILKYVTNAPNPAAFEAKVEAGVSTVQGGRSGFDAHGMVNLPLSSTAALRLVGYDNDYPGFIDDPSRGLTDINRSRFAGGRAALLFQPTETFSIRFNALYQNRSYENVGAEDVYPNTLRPIYGTLVQENLVNQPGSTVTQLYNVTLNWDAGFADLLSTTSYANYHPNTTFDYSKEFGATATAVAGQPYGVALGFDDKVNDFTQELRLASRGESSLQWQVGAFFTNENATNNEPWFEFSSNATPGVLSDPLDFGGYFISTHYREYAGFANLDYRILPTLDVAVGGRYSKNEQTFHENAPGLFGGGTDFETNSSQGVFTYSGDIRWHLTTKNMLYARIAEGFVPGGPNDVVPTAPLPGSYSSSTAVNYEIGLKSSWLDNRATLELSAFHIDWRRIQILALIGGFGSITNGGSARSDGVEWDFAYVPLQGLTLNFNGAYTDAHLTQATPHSVGGEPGDRLPAVPLWETSASAEYDRAVIGDISGFVGVDWRFTGLRYADFSATGPRQSMPSFKILDLRAGIETHRWSATVYVKNVGNVLAINSLQAETLAGGNGPQSAVVYTPRTIGLTLTAKF